MLRFVPLAPNPGDANVLNVANSSDTAVYACICLFSTDSNDTTNVNYRHRHGSTTERTTKATLCTDFEKQLKRYVSASFDVRTLF